MDKNNNRQWSASTQTHSFQESPWQLPEGWKIQKVKDIFVLGRGRIISQEEMDNNQGIYPVYSSQTAKNGELGRLNCYDFDGEYITWTTDGAYAGTVFHRSGQFNCTNVCGILKAKGEHISVKFFAYLLSSKTKKHVSYLGNPKLMNDVMADIDVITPSQFWEQHTIAAILSTVDEIIEKTDRLIIQHQRIKQGLIQDLFRYGIDESGQIRSEQTHCFKDSPVGRMPEEWELKTLKEICIFLDGKRVPIKQKDRTSMKGFVPYYGASGIIDWVDGFIFDEELILLGEDGENIISRNLPLAFVIHGKSWVNNHAHVIKPNHDMNIDFLAAILEKTDYADYVSGSIQPKLSQKNCRNIPIVKPSLAEQSRIASVLSDANQAIEKEKSYRQKLLAMKRGLMDDLLTGKVRVNFCET